MKNRKFSVPFLLGICLIVISLGFLLFTQLRTYWGVQKSQRVAAQLQVLLQDRAAGVPGTYSDPGMPVLEVENADYVALVEIPAFHVVLPVADQWDNNRPALPPARFFGSAYDGTLILGGTDHPRQFGFCDAIEHGTLVTVTDMTGTQFTYIVTQIDRAKHADTDWLQDADSDLVLFCRDTGSFTYIAVRCAFAYG